MSHLDDPKEWGSYIPPPFDPTGFQRRIDVVTGLAPSGKPILWLRWTHDVTELRFGVNVFIYGVKDGKTRPFIPPRWVLHQRQEPGQYWDSWQATRYQEGPDGKMRDRGEPPQDGYYAHLLTIAEHNDYCCDLAYKRDREKCFGQYKPPDDVLLEGIRRARDAREYVEPMAPISERGLQAAAVAAKAKMDAIQAKNKEEQSRLCQEYARDNIHKLYGDTGTGYSFGFAQNEAGLFVPESVKDASTSTNTTGS